MRNIIWEKDIIYEKWHRRYGLRTNSCLVECPAIVWWKCTWLSGNLLAPSLE